MLMIVKTNGAEELVINLPVEKVEYVQDMIRMFETNVTAIKGNDFIGYSIGKLNTEIKIGNEVVYGENAYGDKHPTLIITASDSSDIVESYEPLPMSEYVSVKNQIDRLHATNKTLAAENEYLKNKIADMERSEKEKDEEAWRFTAIEECEEGIL